MSSINHLCRVDLTFYVWGIHYKYFMEQCLSLCECVFVCLCLSVCNGCMCSYVCVCFNLSIKYGRGRIIITISLNSKL